MDLRQSPPASSEAARLTERFRRCMFPSSSCDWDLQRSWKFWETGSTGWLDLSGPLWAALSEDLADFAPWIEGAQHVTSCHGQVIPGKKKRVKRRQDFQLKIAQSHREEDRIHYPAMGGECQTAAFGKGKRKCGFPFWPRKQTCSGCWYW